MQDTKVVSMDGLSVKDAAKALGVHADTVWRWISDGKIIAKKRGKGRGQYCTPASAMIRFAQPKT